MRYSNPQADCRKCLQFKQVIAILAKFVIHKKAQIVRGFGKQSLNHQWIDIERKTNLVCGNYFKCEGEINI